MPRGKKFLDRTKTTTKRCKKATLCLMLNVNRTRLMGESLGEGRWIGSGPHAAGNLGQLPMASRARQRSTHSTRFDTMAQGARASDRRHLALTFAGRWTGSEGSEESRRNGVDDKGLFSMAADAAVPQRRPFRQRRQDSRWCERMQPTLKVRFDARLSSSET